MRVRPRRTRTLEAGTYDDITIFPRGTLLLTGGTYSLDTLRVLPTGTVRCLNACNLHVNERVSVGARAHLVAASEQTASDFAITIARERGTGLYAGARSRITAVIYAPAATVHLGTNGRFIGRFVGARVDVAPGAQLTRGAQ